jgi:arylsulfatase A-like enzyme
VKHWNRRIVLASLLGLALSLQVQAQATKPAAGASGASGEPNVVILIGDQLRYQSCGYAGDRKAITPNLDRLASEGVSFKNFVSSTPVCSAFRASLLTGKYASSTGVVVNELRISPNHDALAHVFGAAGYDTALIGKWHLWANQAGGHNRIANAYIPPGPGRLGFDYFAGYNFGHLNYKARYFLDTPEPINIKGYGAAHFTDLAIDNIKKHAKSDKPFAMVVAYSPPHDPWGANNVPPKWYEKFKDVEFKRPATWKDDPDPRMDRNTDPKRWLARWKPNIPEYMRVYYAMTASLDEQVGRVLKALKETGQEDNTIVVFVSDHGEMFGAQGRVFKMTFYEESARVPMLIRWPKNIPAGSVSDACMASPDIMPTLLGLTKLPVPKAVEGMDLSQVVRGEKGKEPEFAFLQGMGHTYLWRDGFEWRAIRDKQYTYAKYLSDGKELLFDNIADPIQAKDLAGDPKHAAKLKELRGKMQAKMMNLNDTFEKCSWYRDNWTDGKRNIIRGGKGPF